jgi:hypothetical protein
MCEEKYCYEEIPVTLTTSSTVVIPCSSIAMAFSLNVIIPSDLAICFSFIGGDFSSMADLILSVISRISKMPVLPR